MADAALPAPANLVATAASSAQVGVTWDAVAGANHYELQRSSNNGPFALVASPTGPSYTDTGVGPGIVTYLYRVQAVTSGGAKSGYSNVDLATTIVFVDDPLIVGSTVVKTAHITQLRDAVNALRAAAGLTAFNGWTDNPLTAGTLIKAVHIQQLRDQVTPARSALGFVDPPFTDSPLAAGVNVKAIHVNEVRSRVR